MGWLFHIQYPIYLIKGSFYLNNDQSNKGSVTTQVQGAVDNWSPENSSLVLLKAVFLSGIQTGISGYNIGLTNITFDKIRGVIGVTLANASKGIEQVTITYIIFISPHISFYLDSFSYPGPIPNSDYGIIGSSGFSLGLSGARYYGINI